jgi:UDP-2,3-diacylglucosamine hydrolase
MGRWLPEVAVRSLGARASRTSRNYTSNVKVKTDDEVRETIRKHARWAYIRKPFDIFVSGHVHVPEDSTQTVGEGSFRCINLGTWLKQPMVLDVQGSNAALRTVDEFLMQKVKNA